MTRECALWVRLIRCYDQIDKHEKEIERIKRTLCSIRAIRDWEEAVEKLNERKVQCIKF